MVSINVITPCSTCHDVISSVNVITSHKHLQAEILGVKYELEDSFNAGLYDSNTEGFTFVPTLLHPTSTGQVCFLEYSSPVFYIFSKFLIEHYMLTILIMKLCAHYEHN